MTLALTVESGVSVSSGSSVTLVTFLAFTVTRQVYFLPAQRAVTLVFPAFFARTLPDILTEAMFAFLLFHVTFLRVFFTFNWVLLPTVNVIFVLFNFGFLAADA